MREVLRQLWRVIPATVLLTLISSASYWFLNTFKSFPDENVRLLTMLAWLLSSRFLVAAVLSYTTLRARWSGTQLVCAIFVVYFGINTFITITQAFLVAPSLVTAQVAALLTAHGFLVALAFSFVLVVLMGRMWRAAPVAESRRLHLPAREWLWKFGVSAAVWVGLYVAAQMLAGAHLRALYVAAGMPPWWERVMLQTGRALLVVVFVLPVVKMLAGGRIEAGLTVGFLLCILGGVAPMMFPTSAIPEAARLVALVEGGATNLIFGFVVGYLFSREPRGY